MLHAELIVFTDGTVGHFPGSRRQAAVLVMCMSCSPWAHSVIVFLTDLCGWCAQVIAASPNVCNYLHMPAQSGSSSMLHRMKRGYTREAYDALVQRARDVIPNVALSTDMITGVVHQMVTQHPSFDVTSGRTPVTLASQFEAHPLHV